MSIQYCPDRGETTVSISTKGVPQADLHVWLAAAILRTSASIASTDSRLARRKLVAVLAGQVRTLRKACG